MYDNFFSPMTPETTFILGLAEQYAPDIIVGLHGAANMGNGIYSAGGMVQADREEALAYEKRLCDLFREKNWRYINTGCFSDTKRSFNLTTALYFVCGAMSITWECHQGVVKEAGEKVPENIHEEILDSHLCMFEETLRTAYNRHK